MKKIIILGSLFVMILTGCSKDSNKLGSSTGKGGSLARFTIAKEHLYVVDGNKLHTFGLKNPGKPSELGSLMLSLEGAVETIYPWEDQLFIGTMSAMHIISISDPDKPKYLGSALHVTACDPVVADDQYAYVTVRTGNNCGGNTNTLQVFDVTNPQVPALKSTIQLTNPHGLGLSGQHLYVCDADAGLVIFDVSNAKQPTILDTVTGHKFVDCIPNGNLLITMVSNGMVLYDISDPAKPVLLSEILN